MNWYQHYLILSKLFTRSFAFLLLAHSVSLLVTKNCLLQIMAFTLIFFVMCCLSLALSQNASSCDYIYVKPASFEYSGWYQYESNGKKFGSAYWYSIRLNSIQLVINQNQWQFYNWIDKNN